jgi:uncharacterized membrane protein YdjX (TVP38/TMEM64 family)
VKKDQRLDLIYCRTIVAIYAVLILCNLAGCVYQTADAHWASAIGGAFGTGFSYAVYRFFIRPRWRRVERGAREARRDAVARSIAELEKELEIGREP